MSDEIDAVLVEIIIEKVNYLICIVYRPRSAHTDYYEKILDMLDKVDAEEKDNLIMGGLKFDYKLHESLSSNPLYYIENAYGNTQMITEVTRKTTNTESIIDILLTSNPEIHIKVGTLEVTIIGFKLSLLYIVMKPVKLGKITMKLPIVILNSSTITPLLKISRLQKNNFQPRYWDNMGNVEKYLPKYL